MRRRISTTILFAASIAAMAPSTAPNKRYVPNMRIADICYKTGERNEGSTKSCLYDRGGATYELTVGYLESCPDFVNR